MASKGTESAATAASSEQSSNEELVEATLFRLTHGLPRAELQMIISESEACEAELLKEIELLEQASTADVAEDDDNPDITAIRTSVLTPLDQYWTASALLGRLRDDFILPRIPTAAAISPYTIVQQPSHGNKTTPIDAAALVSLTNLPAYSQRHEQPTLLMALYKKLSSHRSALVFRKPVKDEEAPGYSERIQFKMDLGLMRKFISAGTIASYQDFHQYTALISHNCVKFNGRESDYGLLAREFEQAADEMVWQAVVNGAASGGGPNLKKPPPELKQAPVSTSTEQATDVAAAPASAAENTGTNS